MNNIAENILRLKEDIPSDVKLVAVSKTKPLEDVMKAYDAGQRIFGENRVQELIVKQPELPADIKWHMIGHLQTNKVKFIAPYISMIESVDSVKLLNTINKEGAKNKRLIDCLLQFHIASEETKHGFELQELRAFLDTGQLADLSFVRIRGVMGMGTFTDNMEIVRNEFRYLKSCFDELKESYFSNNDEFAEVSMGMSGDYSIAIEEGSTMVRLGTTIFGARYCKTDNN